MADSASIINQALKLKANERIKIAEQILHSLNVSNPEIDEAWAMEANARVEGYDRGEIETVPVREVFAKYRAGER